MWRQLLADLRAEHDRHLSEVFEAALEENYGAMDNAIRDFLQPHLEAHKEKARMTVYKYAFIDNDNTEQSFETLDKDKAVEHAQEHCLAILEKKYTYDDSELVSQWDFRETPEAEEPED